ncbi:MAG: helix-turn-helix domain-containing protein [Promethearchaeota archaeon]
MIDSDIVHISFTFNIPEARWLYRVSLENPGIVFNILSMYMIDERKGITLLEGLGFGIGALFKNIHFDEGTISVTTLHRSEDHWLLSVKSTSALILKAFIKKQVMLQYPISIKEGRATVSVVAYRNQIDDLIGELEDLEVEPVISRIGKYQPKPIFSAPQRDFLLLALQQGYFDVPRGITQVKLAKQLGLSPSTLSENIRRVIKKLVTSYFSFA